MGKIFKFPYDVKLRLLAHSRSFLANQKARNAIVGAENLLKLISQHNIMLQAMNILTVQLQLEYRPGQRFCSEGGGEVKRK